MSIANLITESVKPDQNITVNTINFPYAEYLVDFGTGTTVEIDTTTISGSLNLRNLGAVADNGTAVITMNNPNINFFNGIVLYSKRAANDNTGRLLRADLNNVNPGVCTFNLTNTTGGPLSSLDLNPFAYLDYIIVNRGNAP